MRSAPDQDADAILSHRHGTARRGGLSTPPPQLERVSLLRDRQLWASILGLVLSVSLSLALVVYLGVVVLVGLVSGGAVLQTLVALALPVLAAFGLFTLVFVLSLVGLVRAIGRSLSVPTSERAADAAALLERLLPPLRVVELSERLRPPAPTTEERVAELKRRYVAGDLSEAEFERAVGRLLGTGEGDDVVADAHDERSRARARAAARRESDREVLHE